jgi:hypothetical protein
MKMSLGLCSVFARSAIGQVAKCTAIHLGLL